MSNLKYHSDGKYQVFANGKVIARSYVSDEHGGNYAVRILQGMPRAETWAKIIADCPEFAKNNEMDPNKTPDLFSK